MSDGATETPFWIKFFKDAGIPAGDATGYAIKFTDHRIRKSMLCDLTKEYLTDMGIDALGDIIAILKHAKAVHAQDVKERALMGLSPATNTPPQVRRSTPASRTIQHYIGSESNSPVPSPGSPHTMSEQMAARLGPVNKTVKTKSALQEVVPVPKNRRVFKEHEGKYKITMPQGSTPKTKNILQKKGLLKSSSVFDRLGKGETTNVVKSPTITVTGLGKVTLGTNSQAQRGVFSRLGGKKAVKRPATSTSQDADEDEDDDDDDDVPEPSSPLEYQGVFKGGLGFPAKKKMKTVAKPEPTSTSTLISDRLETLSVKKRLGGKTEPVSKATVPTKTKKTGILQRLGKKKTSEPVSSTTSGSKTKKNVSQGVFSRLGKPV